VDVAHLHRSLASLADEEHAEATVEPGPSYRDGAPVRVRVRKRGRRYDMDDEGAAVRLAERPHGWLDVATSVAVADALNVNRGGVVFVPAVEGRDLAALASRVAVTSARLYGELLELDPDT
jgi:hypothetical protein